jgi:hypothetical protein
VLPVMYASVGAVEDAASARDFDKVVNHAWYCSINLLVFNLRLVVMIVYVQPSSAGNCRKVNGFVDMAAKIEC